MAASVYTRFGSSALTGQGQSARIHTVIGGESLPIIAAYEYSTGYDSEAWRQIAEYNDIEDLDAITVGTVLSIPPLAASST